jgi:hypothetical protein
VEITRADDVVGRIGRVKLGVTESSSSSNESEGTLYHASSSSSVCSSECSLSDELGGEESSD